MTPTLPRRCPNCGAALSMDDAGPGVCPACRMGFGLEMSSQAPTEVEPPRVHGHPDRIDRYRILDVLGEGGMGTVYLAEQTEPIRRRVALKLIKLGMDSRQIVARFESERQALALMNHPNVAKVYDAGISEDGRPYFVMEHVSGLPITDYCDRHRLDLRDRLELFIQACEALQHAHQKGIIHRDVKPSNVLVGVEDETARVKVIDFGVAKATSQKLTDRTVYTQQGIIIGTPEYMSPEQAGITALDVDTRADIYSLGVLLYELLVGALPFDPKELRHASDLEMLRIIREVDPPRPAARISSLGDSAHDVAKRRRTDVPSLARQLRGELEWITMRAMEKDPARRYSAASELAADVRRYLAGEPVLARPQTTIYRLKKFTQRHRVGAIVGATLILALIGFGVTMAVQARRIARERNRAERVSEFLTELFRVSDPSEARGNAITAREILDRGTKKLVEDLANEPEVQAQLLLTVGRVYSGLGLYGTALPLLERSVAARRQLLGALHPDTLRSMNALAMTYENAGRFAEAEKVMTATVAGRSEALGAEHPETLASRRLLGVIYERQGRNAEAEAIYLEILDADRRVLGPEHRETVWALHSLGTVNKMRGRYAEAEKYYREAAEIWRRTLGEDHPDTLWAMNNQATMYSKLGRHEEAERLHRQTLEMRLRVFGPEHARTLASKANLAGVLSDLHRNEEAEALFRDTLETSSRVLGPEHRNTLLNMHELSKVELELGRQDEAESLARRALETQRRVLGSDHVDTLDTMELLAAICKARNRRDEAMVLLRETLDGRRRAQGEDHPDTQRVAAMLSSMPRTTYLPSR